MRRKILIYSIWAVGFAALAAWYALCYRNHFYWQEQNQIFLDTPEWIAGYFGKPAWLGCMAGDWLTQFYVYPTAGAVIQTLVIALCTLLFERLTRRFKLFGGPWWLTPVFACLLVACSFSEASNLAFFLCVAGGLSLGYVRIGGGRNIILAPVLTGLSYWMFGFGALLTVYAILLGSSWPKWKEVKKWLPGMLSAAVLFGLPALLCRSYSLPYAAAYLYPGLIAPSKPDMKLERRLAIAEAYYKKDYEEAKRLSAKDKSPDDFTAFYYYLASAVEDSLPDNLLRYPVKRLGTLTTIGEKTPLPIINMMNDLYFELGDMTYAERAAMMRNVFSPRNRNVRMVGRLAEINLVSGDTLAACKYLRILDRTHAYSEWSGSRKPGQMPAEVEKDILRRRSMSNTKDNLRLGDNCRNIILELLESNPDNTVALDYLLCTDLLLKDMDTFKMDYDTYCMAKGNPRYKSLYQQALMIYLAGTDAPQEEWEKYIVQSPDVQRFDAYSRNRGSSAFADTYWYYFDKAKM